MSKCQLLMSKLLNVQVALEVAALKYDKDKILRKSKWKLFNVKITGFKRKNDNSKMSSDSF